MFPSYTSLLYVYFFTISVPVYFFTISCASLKLLKPRENGTTPFTKLHSISIGERGNAHIRFHAQTRSNHISRVAVSNSGQTHGFGKRSSSWFFILMLARSARSPLNRRADEKKRKKSERKEGKKPGETRSTKAVRRIAAAFFSVKFNQGYPSAIRSGPIELIRTRLSIILCVFIANLQMDTVDRDVLQVERERDRDGEVKLRERKDYPNERESVCAWGRGKGGREP